MTFPPSTSIHSTDIPPKSKKSWIGPGLIMAATGIGASDIISATVGGAHYGVTLLWALMLGAFFKFVLTEGLARWQLATGETIIEGWARYLPRWVILLFAIYLVLWSIAVSGALVSGCGLAIENITAGAIPHTWGGFAHAIIAFLFIYGAKSSGFEKVMKPLIGLMFLGIVTCAAFTFSEPLSVLRGLFLPIIPMKSGTYVASLIGGVGGSLTLLSYNYLLREKKKTKENSLLSIRIDLAVAYIFTAIFGFSVMLIANRVFHMAGIIISDREAVSRMAGQLTEVIGPIGFYIYSIGFWAAVVASLMGVWELVPTIFADCYGLLFQLSPEKRAAAMETSSWQHRLALGFMALVSVPFAFLGRPLLVVVAFTVIGSLFIPFLAATLLYLNNRVRWTSKVPHNNTTTNIILIFVVLLFLIIGGLEVFPLFF